MVIYNIKTRTAYDNPLAQYDTGNSRESLKTKPIMGAADYTECKFALSSNFELYQVNECRLNKTLAEHGSQLSYDIMIDNIFLRK